MTDHQTVQDLQARLKRLTFAIHGDDSARIGLPSPTQTHGSHPAAQIKDLQRQLQSLASRSGAVNEVLQLQAKHPEVLSPPKSNVTLPPTALAALVVSHARLYESVSAQLNTLQTLSVPDAAPLTALSALQPRISKASDRQQQQAREFAELRARSAAVVEQWYAVGVLGMGEKWAEWEERLRDVEITVRRMEGAAKRERGLV
nr:hypothetical protein B0A51_07127 [Rachicladosporium sp. CCFEE 5018]